MRVIAESGAAYTACVLVTFIVSATRSNAMYPTADMVRSTYTFRLETDGCGVRHW